MKLRVALYGALGRMGQMLMRLIAQNPDIQLVAALTKPHDPRQGQDAGMVCQISHLGIPITFEIAPALSNADVVIDFSTAQATPILIEHAIQQKVPLVIGTTGFNGETTNCIKQASAHIPILQSANTSLGIAVLFQLIEQAKKQLPHFDVEMVEIHHRNKKDAPSGTALLLTQAITQEQNSETPFVYGRKGLVGVRTQEEVGISAIRGGDVIGEHTVYFFGPGERIELTHKASSREVFAHGALTAAKWIVKKPPGLYNLQNMVQEQSLS